MLLTINHSELDRQCTIERVTKTPTAKGQSTEVWAAEHTNVYFKWLPPLKGGSGNETIEGRQVVASSLRSALIHDEGRTITPKDRISYSGKYYHITVVRPYMGDSEWTVLDCIEKDR